ncbi:spore coat-associated protein S [Paenibacillus phyllosphaerae]|uniref:Spore coat-associated protein S n=1 Tax=Paenibacillus phyllosphaerae TaxID=274593 RepID=A0A7W5B3D3_9BACL|nr:CotS family spore coat protein [Paenibacillus phyllosphaerae]MBB3113685.1 spore coat-associated protein S [Paenibacillus phyllosphaerae]
MAIQSQVTAILAQYPIQVKSVRIIQDKGKKAAWTVETSTGTKILKKSPARKERLLFLMQATKHLQNNGASIPRIVATREGVDFAEDANGACYVLSEAVQTTGRIGYTGEELNQIMREMAKFHIASRGFQANRGTKSRNHLGRWENGYQNHLDNLELFKALANRSSSTFSKLFMQHVDAYIKQGNEALAVIQGNAYRRWVNKVSVQRNLCHQDFAAGNLIKTSKGFYIIDMDSITLDLPARDIRKIFNKVMKKTGWSAVKATAMLRAYHERHPLTKEECSVIYADLLFPHLFYGLANKYFTGRLEWTLEVTNRKLGAMIQDDKNRLQMLAQWDTIVNNALK